MDHTQLDKAVALAKLPAVSRYTTLREFVLTHLVISSPCTSTTVPPVEREREGGREGKGREGGREGKGREGGKGEGGREGKGREGKGREGEGGREGGREERERRKEGREGGERREGEVE